MITPEQLLSTAPLAKLPWCTDCNISCEKTAPACPSVKTQTEQQQNIEDLLRRAVEKEQQHDLHNIALLRLVEKQQPHVPTLGDQLAHFKRRYNQQVSLSRFIYQKIKDVCSNDAEHIFERLADHYEQHRVLYENEGIMIRNRHKHLHVHACSRDRCFSIDDASCTTRLPMSVRVVPLIT